MKKIFTLFAVAAMAFTAMAETTGTQYLANPNKLKENVLEGEALGATAGWKLQCMNEAKNLESGNEFTIEGNAYRAIKLSNGAQNTLTLPEGLYATKVTFYATINKDAATNRPCFWKEVAGVEYTADDNKGIIDSYKNYEEPNVQSFDVPCLNSFTFANTGEQPFTVLVVDYTDTPSQSGIADITVDENAPVEYFNLQGIRVANPENGLYIRRQGNKVEKVYIK